MNKVSKNEKTGKLIVEEREPAVLYCYYNVKGIPLCKLESSTSKTAAWVDAV